MPSRTETSTTRSVAENEWNVFGTGLVSDVIRVLFLSLGVQPDGRRPGERAPAQEEGHEAEGRRRQEEKVRSCRIFKSNDSFINTSFSGNSNRLRRERLLGGELQVIPGCK